MEPIRIKNLLVVWLLLSFAHFSLHQVTIFRKLAAHSSFEMSRVQSAITEGPVDEKSQQEALDEKWKQGVIERILAFPLLPLLYEPEPGKEYYHGATIPIAARGMNSLVAGLFWHLVGFLITAFLPAHFRVRKFFEGRGIHEEGAVPRILDKAPPIGVARALAKTEKGRFGPALVIAFFHLALTQISLVLAAADKISGKGNDFSFFTQAMRFPLTPFLVKNEFWEGRYQNPAVENIAYVANSLIAAIFIIFLYRLLRHTEIFWGGKKP